MWSVSQTYKCNRNSTFKKKKIESKDTIKQLNKFRVFYYYIFFFILNNYFKIKLSRIIIKKRKIIIVLVLVFSFIFRCFCIILYYVLLVVQKIKGHNIQFRKLKIFINGKI